MSVTYIPADLRSLVLARAEALCEYCLIAEDDTFFGCEIDHVISEKHGGETDADNLALACVFCNQAKGSDVGSLHWETKAFVRFFNPRTDHWSDHFELIDSRIQPATSIGEVTARILPFNNGERILERRTLQRLGRNPSTVALTRMRK